MVTSSELITDFVNTRELLEGTEELATPADLIAWLERHGLFGEARVHADDADLRRAQGLREALRGLLLAHNGVEVDRAAQTAVLDDAARQGGVELRFGEAGAELVPSAAGVSAALGRIAAAVHDAMNDGSWDRLKACRADDCQWVFVDHAKNQSRAWCSMRSCGNRAKARAYRDRHRAPDA